MDWSQRRCLSLAGGKAMEYRMVLGRFKKGKLYVMEGDKINPDLSVEDEINHLLSKGWKLHGKPDIGSAYGWANQIIYHLVKD